MLAVTQGVSICCAVMLLLATIAAHAASNTTHAQSASCMQRGKALAAGTRHATHADSLAVHELEGCATPPISFLTLTPAAAVNEVGLAPPLNHQQLAAIRIPIPLAPTYLFAKHTTPPPLLKSHQQQVLETHRSFAAAINKGHAGGHIDKMGNLVSFKNERQLTLWSHVDIKVDSCLSSGCPYDAASGRLVLTPLIHW